MSPMYARQWKYAIIQVLLIAVLFSAGLPAFTAWHVLLDGVDISSTATFLERGETILVNATALAPMLHLQVTVRGAQVTIRDTLGNEWSALDGGVTLQNAGHSLALPYPLLLQEGKVYLPIETVNILTDRHLVLDKVDDVTLTVEHIGDGWQGIEIPKPTLTPGQRLVTAARNGADDNAATNNLPPMTDHLCLDVGVGYVQDADMGMAFNASGAWYGNDLQMTGLVTQGRPGTQINNGYLSLLNRGTGHGIELGNLSSDLLGGMDGMRYSWRTSTDRRPSLSLYWNQPDGNLHHPIVSYRDDLAWSPRLSLGGEVNSQGEVALHGRYQPGRLGLYADFRHRQDTAQSGTGMFATYALWNGITLSGGMSRYGAGTSLADWSNIAVYIPLRHGFDLSLDHSKSQANGAISTANIAMLTIPVGPLRVLTRFSAGQTENHTQDAPLRNTHQEWMVSTGYNIRPNLRVDIQTLSRRYGDSSVNHSSQFVGSYYLSPRSNVQLVSSLLNPGSSDQLHLRWNFTLSPATAFSLDYGQITPFQNDSTASGRGFMLMLHTRWGINTPVHGASVTGTVRDETGQPLTGCLLRLGDYRMLTNASGKYHFAHVAPGDYTISLDNSSLPANYRSISGVNRVTVRNSDRITRDFLVIPLYAIAGKVLLADSDGRLTDGGVSGVVIHLGDAVTVTDVTGAFRFYNLAPGMYTVRLDTEHLSTTLAPVGVTALPVTLQPSGESEELLLKVMPHEKDIIYQNLPGSGK